MNAIIPLTEARNNFTKLVDETSKTSTRFTITKNGKPEAVIMSAEDYESLVETLEILSDPKTMASLKRSEKQKKQGKFKTLEQVAKELNVNLLGAQYTTQERCLSVAIV